MRVRAAFFFLIFISANFLWAEKHPDFEPFFSIEELFDSDKAPSLYSPDQIFEAGLLFSECQPGSAVWERCMEKLDAIKAEAGSREMQALSEADRGRAILKYLYQDFLSKYDFNQTRLDTALETGLYNCVSSAVLYLAAARAAGLEVYGQHTSQHAFCTVYTASEKAGQKTKIDVETTNPYGFNPGSKEAIENQSQVKKYYVVPKKYYANRQQVSDGVFTGLIAGNLCSEYIKSSEYHKAIPLGAARFNLVKDESSSGSAFVRQEFDILPCNYINVRADSAEEYGSMLQWFTRFIDRWGNNSFIQKNMDSTFNNLFVLCIEEKNYPVAEKYYDILSPYVSQKQLDKAQEALADVYILSKTDGQDFKQQLQTIAEIKENQDFSQAQQKRADLYMENAWIELLNDYMRRSEYSEGYREALLAEEQLPQSSSVKRMKQAFYSNCIARIHNEFARLANGRKFEEALQVLEDGLKLFPGDKSLSRDLSDLKKVMDN